MAISKRSAFAAALLAATALAPAQMAPPELRAAWISRFEWPGGTESAIRSRITTMMETLAANNFNAVLFQIRGECNTLYPSPYEPWGPQFNWTDPGWDPVAFAIEEAHRNGLEFHAYINTHTITSSVLPPAQTTPQHMYNLHGPSAAESWAIHDANGNPVGVTDSYVWMSPGVPAAEAWTRQQVMYVVNTYNVDGIHFDRIRTPGSQYSRDPISLARFAGDGNPDGEVWGDFMRSQITRQLRRIYAQVMQVKPHVKMSAAPFGICRRVPGGYQGTGTESYFVWYQDSFGWMQNGVLDCLFPQIYWDIGSAHPYEVLLKDFMDRDGGRHIYPGSVTTRNYIAQVHEARRQGALGHTNFSYNSMDFSLYSEVYELPAPIPEMPWKTNPTTGIVLGTVTDIADQQVVDARVTITGSSYNHLSGGDGLYAILNIAPGTYTINGSKTGVGTDSETITIAAGEVLQVDLQLTTSRGELTLDRALYRLGEQATIRLVDSDLVGESTQEVTITSEAVPEGQTLTLQKTTGATFESTIALADESTPAPGAFSVRRGGTLTVSYQDAFDGTGPSETTATANIDEWVVVHDQPMDENPNWTTEGLWAFGVPLGNSGSHGGPDPTSGFTGPNVYGYNLAGAYANNMANTEWLTTTPIDCSNGTATRLEFRRWLHVEQSRYDRAFLQVSNDGSTWHTIWQNPDTTIGDTEWLLQTIDIAAHADGQPAVQLRWGMGPTDGGWTYSGWNIDDVQVLQKPTGESELWSLY